ncbi:hypothetical protein CIV90_26690 [Escherichia coli]|nr:hypothetical protein [Escherichia coli]
MLFAFYLQAIFLLCIRALLLIAHYPLSPSKTVRVMIKRSWLKDAVKAMWQIAEKSNKSLTLPGFSTHF